MKAMIFEQFGAAKDVLNLKEVKRPVVQQGEVLVRLHTSAVNPSDVKKRAGLFPELLSDGDIIPNSDGAGVIQAVGDGVPKARVGERVWVYQAQYGRRFGTSAEFIRIESRRAAHLPDEASFEVGACLGIPAMTAHRCVFADGPVSHKRVLITGGAGRVGYYAIQWAKMAGAFVIATASNQRDRESCLEVGADAVVNHRDADFAEQILQVSGNNQLDRVIDVQFGANLDNVLKVVKTGAVIATYSSTQVPELRLPFYKMMYLDLTLRCIMVYAMPESAKNRAINDIESALKNNKLSHRIAEIMPLKEAVKAHKMVESGTVRGCILLSI
ncbi:NADPH:quinone reductase [Shewanella surugensis]|uniref:NADPH:quinone reductase n=1 Tax=Shewanella surugensis TaxID=212020 RepID=A0ABT0LEM8_9GAMM|nr:NADPH:quinone reductase [Shewanella surugensis]MCL1126133.1 NADPH:quinone reductase [Shewanella surugensis]